MSQTIFIADLHLSEHTTALNTLFARSLQQWRGQIDALYILGDFFDVWVGDDDDSIFIRHIKSLLTAFSQQTPLYLMHGNRDFLLGNDFATSTGSTLLAERTQINLYGQHYVLVHGDELCTEDLAYQQFRSQSRHPQWQAAMMAKSLAERRLLGTQIRQISEGRKNTEGKSEMADATEHGILTLMQNFINTPMPTLIHGHTHRPAQHQHKLDGQVFTRYVLQDWHHNMGGYLSVDGEHGVSNHLLSA